MTPERRKQIETLLAQITPGEWRAQGSLNDATVSVDGYILISCDVRNETDEALIETHQNARFIAAAPGMVRELLAEVERLTNGSQDKCAICSKPIVPGEPYVYINEPLLAHKDCWDKS